MKTQIANLKDEKRDVKKVAQLVRSISDQLKEDQLLLQPYLEAVLSSVIPTFGNLFPVMLNLNVLIFGFFHLNFLFYQLLYRA